MGQIFTSTQHSLQFLHIESSNKYPKTKTIERGIKLHLSFMDRFLHIKSSNKYPKTKLLREEMNQKKTQTTKSLSDLIITASSMTKTATTTRFYKFSFQKQNQWHYSTSHTWDGRKSMENWGWGWDVSVWTWFVTLRVLVELIKEWESVREAAELRKKGERRLSW